MSRIYLDYVFPTCVGMNRFKNKIGSSITSVPHMRGDEPQKQMQKQMQ